MNRKLIIIFITVLAVTAIIISLIQAGSPKQARWQQYDQQRLADLQQIEQAIINYAANVQKQTFVVLLPSTLQELGDFINPFLLIDPIINKPYEYYRLESDAFSSQFKLCAVFQTSSTEVNFNYQWRHPSGYYCFIKQITPQQVEAVGRSIAPLVKPEPALPD